MARIFTVLLVLLLAALGLGVLLWYLAYGTGPGFSGEARVPGLTAPVTIAYTESDIPIIEAQSEADLYAGLGYAHALQSAWPMVLWRQAATGSLSTWFQDSTALTLDRHALALGFGAFARQTYDALPDDDRAVLEAYARGVNRAFTRARLNEGDEFVLFDVRAEPWQPWDALAIERLVAYLAIPASALPDSTAPAAYRASPPLRRFVVADSVFRSTLYLGGLEHALAFTVHDDAGTSLVQRQVYGSSALPLFQEVVLRQGGRSTLVASIPGTLMVPSGYDGDTAWSIFLNGTTTLAPVADSLAPDPSYARVTTRSGSESLVTIYRDGSTLLLHDPNALPVAPPPPTIVRDTTGRAVDTLRAPAQPASWRLRWGGFNSGTDLSAWRALLRGELPTFGLFPGAGLVVEGGEGRVLGSPAVTRTLPGGVFAGNHPWAEYVAERLTLLSADSVALDPTTLLTDAYSTWAAELAPAIIAVLGEPGTVDDDIRDASAYLRGWEFRYEPASIAASIFETWMEDYRETTGALPDLAVVTAPPPPPDSTGFVPVPPVIAALKASFRRALSALEQEYGPVGAAWRWQNVQRATRYYPLFTRDTTKTGRQRFAPTLRPDGGHPTALAWGPSLLFPSARSTAAWAASSSAPGWSPIWIRHRNPYESTSRTRRLTDPIEPYRVDPALTPEPSIRLLPADG
ncbi:MAG: penicillin acylase family protein [Rhodothermales bacterium]